MLKLFISLLLVLRTIAEPVSLNSRGIRPRPTSAYVNSLPRGGALRERNDYRNDEFTRRRFNYTSPLQPFFILVTCLLAANSGFLNGLTLSGVLEGRKEAIVAVSGAYTASAIAYNDRNEKLFSKELRIVISYFAGSCLNGVMNPWGIDWSRTQLSLLFSGVLVLLGAFNYFTTNDWDWLVALVAMATGLTNSWTSMLIKENILGTTYFSGTTSDIGTFLGQLTRDNSDIVWKIKLCSTLAAVAASFWAGAYFSVPAAQSWGEVSFLLSVALYLVLYGTVQDRMAMPWRGTENRRRQSFDFGRRTNSGYGNIPVDIGVWRAPPVDRTTGESSMVDISPSNNRRRSRRRSSNSIMSFLSSMASSNYR
mmetsp:Transcript_42850/g.48687  ORF Transcript_42850/g.48687 Transcript_42850/m.48687 type:complete len:366 (+) Transcript_42850:87-1184(+)